MSGKGRETHLEVREAQQVVQKGWETHPEVRQRTGDPPEVREGLGDPSGGLERVRRLTRRSRKGH